jgi:hypothetical protein
MTKKRKKEKASVVKGESGSQKSLAEVRPSRMFVCEGYSITCRLDGLEIRTVDYHAGPLKISWPALERLMVESGLVPPRERRRSRSRSSRSVN